METLEQEVSDAVGRLGFGAAEWKRCGEIDSSLITSIIESDFVNGHPRVWWLSLKNCIATAKHTPDELNRLLGRFASDRVYFLPDPDDGSPVPVFLAHAECINAVLDEMYFFEFYILSEDREQLISANDHNQLLVSRRES